MGKSTAAGWQPGERIWCHMPRLGYKHSLFGCLYSYPSAVSGILPNHKVTTKEDFSEKEAFMFTPSECDHLSGAWRYPGFIEPTYKVTRNSYFTEMSDWLNISGIHILLINFQLFQNICLKIERQELMYLKSATYSAIYIYYLI